MDVKDFILKYLKKHQKVKTSELVKKTGYSRAYLHRFLKELQQEGKVVLIGKTNQAFYTLAGRKIPKISKPKSFRRTLLNKNLSEDLVLLEIKNETDIFNGLKKNIVDILNYAFVEMLNNAIEHSRCKKILVQMKRNDDIVEFRVVDWGVGIFNDIKRKFKLKDIFEAIELLIKGKQTTKPETHTGEGIFFTSKAGDKMFIKGSGKRLIFDNIIDDVFVDDNRKIKGTEVVFRISTNSKRNLSKIFAQYTGDSFAFEKTNLIVKLFELGSNSYISRSQARRLLFGLDKFKEIILDFKNVKTVGQAFADEVFRVWQKKHPQIKIRYINCNKNVGFMIKHALANVNKEMLK